MGRRFDHRYICTRNNYDLIGYRGCILLTDDSSSELIIGIDLSASPEISKTSPFERKYGGLFGVGKVIELLLSMFRTEAIEGLASESS